MSQIDIFGSRANNDNLIPKEGKHQILNGEYWYIPNFFDKDESDNYFSKLRKEIDWRQEAMKLYFIANCWLIFKVFQISLQQEDSFSYPF